MELPWKLPLLLDGATGTTLLGAGMPADACVEDWVLSHPDVLLELQTAYAGAGCDVLYAPTFGANRVNLRRHGLEGRIREMNLELVALTRKAAGDRCLVAGDMTSTGLLVEPFGDASFEELLAVYEEQSGLLKEAGADLIVCETLTSLTDARAALLAARKTGLPVFVTLTVNDRGRTMSGSPLLPCVITLQALGAAAVGFNCSTGLTGMEDWIAEVLPHAAVPLIAKPNAMAKDAVGFDQNLEPEEFAQGMEALLGAGATIVGGCCGTTPAHLAALRRAVDKQPTIAPQEIDVDAASGERAAFFLSDDLEPSPPIPCDSRLPDALIDAEEEYNVARVRVDSEDDILELLTSAAVCQLPTAVYTDDALLLDKVLLLYPGRLLVDSVCEIEKPLLEDIAAQYGAIVY